jgi:hypothetical protein
VLLILNPVNARSKVWVCSLSIAGIEGSNPVRETIICCESCVLSGRSLYEGLITRPEESQMSVVCLSVIV